MCLTVAAKPKTPSAQTKKLPFKMGLFSRTFFLLLGLMGMSFGIWLQTFFSMESGPRALQMAERVITSINVTRSALIYAPVALRPALLLDLATQESLRVQPRDADDVLNPMPRSSYWLKVSKEVRQGLGSQTLIMWSVNNTPGIWVSFDLNQEQYWLVFDREQLSLIAGAEWLGWVLSAFLLAFLGAAISVRFVNRPLARLAQVTQQLSRGETPSPLPEKGAAEIRDMNVAFNRMMRDIRQSEMDREIMLAGISHDLRTPLARMRLEIELSNVSDETRHAIDEDLAQIDRSIGQLMEYARPATKAPEEGINISQTLQALYERERSHTESLGGELVAEIQPNLYALIDANDLKRIVSNLIENARRYGRSTSDDKAYIQLTLSSKGNFIEITVQDQGPGIEEHEIQRLLRPFSRGELARTGVNGAGLGLAIVERLLHQVNGSLELRSPAGQGLTARILIPKLKVRDSRRKTNSKNA